MTYTGKKLMRSTTDKMLGGVCAGFAEYFDLDATLVRVGYALLTIFTTGFPGVILYIVCLFVMPTSDNNNQSYYQNGNPNGPYQQGGNFYGQNQQGGYQQGNNN